MTDDFTENWLNILKSLDNVINQVPVDDLWPASKTLQQVQEKLILSFKSDYKRIKEELLPILGGDNDIDVQTELTTNVLKAWQTGKSPSLCAISAFVADEYFVDMSADFKNALMTASLLGEVEHNPSYHNNMHFKKVLLSAVRLIVEHNEIYKGTNRIFNARDAAMIMIASCIHDLGHDGMGNTIYGVFYPGRLEERSFDLAKPYLLLCGLSEEKDLEELHLMLRCTEVTPLRDPRNPMNQMKAAYRYHFLNDESPLSALKLEDKFKVLEKDKHLVTKALILHEADIATSAGLTYEVAKHETSLFMEEITESWARPSHILGFLTQICNRQFITDAGQRLFGANSSRIYTLAEKDKEGGDEVFAKPDQSDFLTKELSTNVHDAPKSIN